MPGVYQVPVGADIAYVSADGRYIIAGDLYEIDTRVNITEQGRSAARVKLLSQARRARHDRVHAAES